MFCDKNTAAKSASIQNAKATLEFEFTGQREERKADAKRKKKKGENYLRILASYCYGPSSYSLSALSFHFLTETMLFG